MQAEYSALSLSRPALTGVAVKQSQHAASANKDDPPVLRRCTEEDQRALPVRCGKGDRAT